MGLPVSFNGAAVVMLAVCGLVMTGPVGGARAAEDGATSASAGVTTPTAATAPMAADTLSAEEEAAATAKADAGDTQTVVLMGERVSVKDPESAKGPFPNLVDFTTATLGGRVVDLTAYGQRVKDTEGLVERAVERRPDVVVIFTGFADERAETDAKAGSSAEQVQPTLKRIVAGLKKGGVKRVALVPASTEVGALSSANLRLAATDTGAVFVPMGTEVGGQPLQDAFNSLRRELSGEPEAEVTVVPVVTSSTVVGTGAGSVVGAKLPAVAKPDFDREKATLQQELNRIAGQVDMPTTETRADLKVTTGAVGTAVEAEVTSGTYPAGGTLTKRGKEAQENINMRPLPAVKAFRPQIPVPRNEIDKKEPGLSR